MRKEEAIELLKEYIKEDEIYQKYLKNEYTEISDFDEFCIRHCESIDTILQEIEDIGNTIIHLTDEEFCRAIDIAVIDKNRDLNKEVQKYFDITMDQMIELERKDKIIKEMAKYINENTKFSENQPENADFTDGIIRYFENKGSW